jgi:hypothetical protein
MRPRIVTLAGALPCLTLLLSGSALAEPASRTEALHVLSRIAYGPRPGGVDRYIDEQLHPDTIAMPEPLTRRLEALSQDEMSQADLITTYRRVIKAAMDDGTGGAFRFVARLHDFGDKVWLGRPVAVRRRASGRLMCWRRIGHGASHRL